jgi:hypothetical protein
MRRTLHALGLFAALATLAPHAQVAAQAATDDVRATGRFDGVAFPSTIGSFRAVRAEAFADPALGMSVRYVAPGTRAAATLYVYPKRATLEQEFDSSVRSITAYAERSGGRLTAAVDSTDTLTVAGRPGRYALLRMTNDGSAERSLLYLFERETHWVKLRISMDPALRVALAAPMAAFVERTVEAVVPPPVDAP